MARKRIGFESRILISGALAFTPLLFVLATVAAARPMRRDDWWIVAGAAVASVLLFIAVIRAQLAYRLRTLSNLIGALREEDYSVRMRGQSDGGAMGEVAYELDRLTEALREQRLGTLEAAAFVRTVIGEIDSAIFAFDDRDRLQLINRAGERLLARWSEQLIGRTAQALGLGDMIEGAATETRDIAFRGGGGRWLIRRSTFREHGVPHRLLVMSDLSRALREEERLAWQRLLRVLGHELNNSLAPIRSIAGSLQTLIARDERPDDWLDDVQRGLSVIGSRSAGLSRFIDAYAKLTRLPPPRRTPVSIEDVIARAARIEDRTAVRVAPGPPATVSVDGDQIEQLLINLLRNAADAGANVGIEWTAADEEVVIRVTDDGPGISGTANLFVPFFTTKPGGSGIGLALSRMIADAHGGSLALENRTDGVTGAVAVLTLPRNASG